MNKNFKIYKWGDKKMIRQSDSLLFDGRMSLPPNLCYPRFESEITSSGELSDTIEVDEIEWHAADISNALNEASEFISCLRSASWI